MLASIPSPMFYEWKAFYDLDPDAAERNDWGLAHIVQALSHGGKPLREFALPFGDTPIPVKDTQSVAYQEMLIDAWCGANNAIVSAKGGMR